MSRRTWRKGRRINRRRWAAVRRHVFERDGYRCRHCGKAGRLECDHVQPLPRGGDPYDVAGCQTLCRACHIRKTAGENERPWPGRDAWRDLVRERMG